MASSCRSLFASVSVTDVSAPAETTADGGRATNELDAGQLPVTIDVQTVESRTLYRVPFANPNCPCIQPAEAAAPLESDRCPVARQRPGPSILDRRSLRRGPPLTGVQAATSTAG
jgi:hypothetical protein